VTRTGNGGVKDQEDGGRCAGRAAVFLTSFESSDLQDGDEFLGWWLRRTVCRCYTAFETAFEGLKANLCLDGEVGGYASMIVLLKQLTSPPAESQQGAPISR
jgi:hypothetical protein